MSGVVSLLYLAVVLYSWLIVARALLSWLTVRPGTPLHGAQRLLVQSTEPYLSLFRRVLPVSRAGGLGIDWSSLVGLMVLLVVLQVLARL
jgi:YggT family protein